MCSLTFCGSVSEFLVGWDWSEFWWQWVRIGQSSSENGIGLVRCCEKFGRISQNFFESGFGLVRISVAVGQDWAGFFREWVRIGQTL